MEFRYICSECAKTYDIEPSLMLCPDCAKEQQPDQPLRGVLEVELSGKAKPDFKVKDLLPVPDKYFPPIPVGNTAMWQPLNLRKELGSPGLFIKDDGGNPTSSFKDRASYLVSAFAAQYGISEIVLASTGNAGSSMAGVGAAARQRVTLFLPKAAPKAKLIQSLQYGAKVHRVDGSYDQAYELAMEYSRRFGGMSRSTAYNPMTLEGKKTVALEIYQQLGYKVPEYVFVATGDGCILGGVYKGFRDLVKLGLAYKLPTVVAVNAKNSDAMFRAFNSGEFSSRPSSSVADSICVDVPRNGFHALKQLKSHGGKVVTVSDESIIAAQHRLASSCGLFTEPAGAAAFAGFLWLHDELPEKACCVVLTTGNGLKDITGAGQGVEVPEKVITSLDEI
jgi:threonine synthase